MKKVIKLALLAIVAAVACTSCNKEGKEIGTRDQLLGRWQSGQEYIVFYDDNAGDGYAWGKEWNEADGTQESDLVYHGNGWFRWKKGNDYIRTANATDISSAESAVDWKLSSLSDDKMELQQTTRMKTYKKIAAQ